MSIKIDYFNTYLQGGAANAALNVYMLLDKEKIQASFFFMTDLSNGVKEAYISKNGGFVKVSINNSNKSFFSKLKKSVYARLYYREILPFFKGRPTHFEQFSLAFQYFKTPYLLFSNNLPDVIHLNWIAEWIDYPSFFNSVPDNLPIVWTLHDMNPFTGGCHYSWECRLYSSACANCPQLVLQKNKDLAKLNWTIKLNALKGKNIHVVGDSNWITEQAQKSTLFSDVKSFSTIHYSIDFNVFIPKQDKEFIRATHNIPENAFVLCFGAADFSNKRKGFSELIEALKLVYKSNKNLHCLVFGSGNLTIDTSDIPSLHFTGHLPPSQLASIYSASDVFVITSLYEAFGLTAVESMACGTPVIGFNTGGIPDSIENNVSGWLVEAGNSNELANLILRLIDNTEEVETIGNSAINFVRNKFSQTNERGRYMSLYKSITSNKH